MRAGGCDCVCVPVPLYASSQVCVAGLGLRVSFSACITALQGLSTCDTGCDSLCVCLSVLSFCLWEVVMGVAGSGSGHVSLWPCVSFSICAWMCVSILEGHMGA